MQSVKYKYQYDDISDVLYGRSMWNTGKTTQEKCDALTIWKNDNGDIVRFVLDAAKHVVEDNYEVAMAYVNDVGDDFISAMFPDVIPER